MSTFIRKASWPEVAQQFHGNGEIQKAFDNAAGWASRYGVSAYSVHGGNVVLESWTSQELADVMSAMSKAEPRVTVDMVKGVNNAQFPPRLDGLPAVFVKFGDRYGIIDGKHRVNRWKLGGGPWAVLVIHA